MKGMSRCLVPIEHSVNAASVFSSVRWGFDLRIPEDPSQFCDLRPHAGQGSGGWSLSLCFLGGVSSGSTDLLSHLESMPCLFHQQANSGGAREWHRLTDTAAPTLCPSRWCLHPGTWPSTCHVANACLGGLHLGARASKAGANRREQSLHEQVFLLLLGKSPNPHRQLPPDTSLVTPLVSHTLRGGPSSMQYCLKCCLYWVLRSLLEASWFTTSATHTPNPSLMVPSHSRATVLLPYLPQSQVPNNEGQPHAHEPIHRDPSKPS